MLTAAPLIGAWYYRLDRPQPFQVVAWDGAAGTVDVEYFDGTLDEWPLAHWHALAVGPFAAPQDWTGPFDNVEADEADAAPAPRLDTVELLPDPLLESTATDWSP